MSPLLLPDPATHDSIYTAVLGGMTLILIAAAANWFATRRGRNEAKDAAEKANITGNKVDAMQSHLPPDGERLYLMVEATNRSVNHMREDVEQLNTKVDRVEDVMLTHLANHDGKEVKP